MTADPFGRAAIVAVLGAAVAVPACKSAPQRRMESQGPVEPVESIDEAEIALADNERRLQELGIVPPSKPEDGGGGLGYSEGEDEDAGGEAMVTEEAPEAKSTETRLDSPSAGSSTTGLVSRCTRICDIAESTCALAQQVCDLAAKHPDKPRYAKACKRAEQQCDAATEACDTCE